MTRPTVLLADDHPILVEGLKSLLQKEFDLVGVVGDGRALIDEAERLKPDVIITDLSMPTMNGLAALRQLRKLNIRSRVVFLTVHQEAHLAAKAFRAGASGYLIKEAAGEELTTAIHEVLLGRTYVTPRIARGLMSILTGPKDETAQEESPLTVRQLEVLTLIAQGKRMKEIAAELRISVRTAETHKYAMMQTLGVDSTAELVRYAIAIGVIESGEP